MEQSKCIEILELEPEYNQADLIKAYYDKSNFILTKLEESDSSVVGGFAESLLDIANAYIQLRDDDIISKPKEELPLIVFTDASAVDDNPIASFAIVIQNIPKEFDFDIRLVSKYKLQTEPLSSNNMLVISGIVNNVDINYSEMFGIIVTAEILKYLVNETNQKIVIYTDSLTAIKVLDMDKEFDCSLAKYSRLRSYFYKLITDNSIDIKIKKVSAHSGYAFNEIADQSAKSRIRN